VTFNIAHGRGLIPIQGLTSSRKLRLNLRRISDLLGKLGADLVALQEIDECSVWAGSFDHLDYLRAHAGYPHAAFGINNRRSGLVNLCYGNALLSRFPIEETETIVFGKRRVGEKGFLFTEVNVGGRVVPIVNLEWIQKLVRDTGERGHSREAVMDSVVRSMDDYINYITPQFSRTHINFQRVPTVDTSNPFAAKAIPSLDESFVVIHFRGLEGIDFPYLLAMLQGSFISHINTIVVPGGKMGLAMELIMAPLVQRLMEGKKIE